MEQLKPESLESFLERTALSKIKKMLCETAGVDCSGYRDEYLRRRFEIRLKATGANTYGRYLLYIKKNPSELEKLLNDLTINYTTFFRDGDVYDYLEKTLLPLLFKPKNSVRIWSAGCATGEEPYSIAILAHKILGKSINNQLVTIYASDIDRDALSKAAIGKFQKKHLGAMNQALIDQFFTSEGEIYQIKDFVKHIIHFEQFDLMKPSIHHNLDLILCRNVMIYFEKESQQQIHMSFYRSLRDGGYMITGKSEILSGEPVVAFSAVDHIRRVYQKPAK